MSQNTFEYTAALAQHTLDIVVESNNKILTKLQLIEARLNTIENSLNIVENKNADVKPVVNAKNRRRFNNKKEESDDELYFD
jgi:hypothetical protein